MNPEEQSPSDVDLIEQVLAGETNNFAELIRRHHPRVMALCLSMLPEKSAAEDIAQESFLKAYQALPSFRADASFSSWLYRIASNKCLDYIRKLGRERSQSLDELLEAKPESLQHLIASPGPEAQIENTQLVRQILNCLPENYRLILTLREINGLNYEEIAQTMECSIDSVKARLRRARSEFLETMRRFLPTGSV